jgi:glutathione peroxidase
LNAWNRNPSGAEQVPDEPIHRRLPGVQMRLLPLAAALVATAIPYAADAADRAAASGATSVAAAPAGTNVPAPAAACPAFLNREFRRLHSSQKVNLCTLAAGRPLLLVNTASHCGYTSQFRGLQALHEKYGARGLVVVGFPSDSFNQEAADASETAEVCYVNYGVKFTMVETTPVKGRDANPVFQELARQSREPQWNFNKYLVTADGKVAQYFGSGVAPDSAELAGAIERVLR